MKRIPALFPLVLLAAAVPAGAQDLLPTQDAHVYSASANSNYGNNQNLILSAACCPRTFYRAYLKFNLTSIPAQRPARAELWWYQHTGGGAGCLNADLHRVTGSWSESTINWNNKPTHDPTVEASLCIGDSGSPGWKRFDATKIVSDWLLGIWPNEGFTIKDPTEATAGSGRVGQGYSKEYADPGKRPFLRVLFASITPTGVSRIGSTVNLDLFAPQDATGLFVCGTSLGSQPGIRVDTRVIPLNMDPLLILSLTNPAVFFNYIGILDATGHSTALINIPNRPPLVGITIYTAFFTLRQGAPSQIGAISEEETMTIVQ